jgi:Ca2+-binding RTX toxin-like protein
MAVLGVWNGVTGSVTVVGDNYFPFNNPPGYYALGAFSGTAGLPAINSLAEWNAFKTALAAKADQPGGALTIAPFDVGVTHYFVWGGAGGDFVGPDGGSGTVVFYGNGGNDEATIFDGYAATLDGGSGDDDLWTANGADSLVGGDGNDTITADDGADTLQGGAGNDRLYSQNGNDSIDGGTGVDSLIGQSGDDTLSAISGDGGTDTLHGGDGNDLLLAHTAVVDGGIGDDTVVVYGDLIGASTGGSGTDLLDASNDPGGMTMVGLSGFERYRGGAASDVIDWSAAAGVVTMEGGGGEDSLLAGASGDTLQGGAGNDTLSAGGGADSILGGDGVDTLIGGAGADTLAGGAGADAFRGAVADLNGDRITDFAVVDFLRLDAPVIRATTSVVGADTLLALDTNGDGTAEATVTIVGLTNLVARLSEGGTRVNLEIPPPPSPSGPFGGPETQLGTSGSDFIELGAGDDVFLSSPGHDTIDAGSGRDFVQGGEGNDDLRGMADEDVLHGNVGDDQLNGNAGADTLHGGRGNDLVRGGRDGDRLFGDLGADTLFGDLGSDTLTGGVGADRFVFGSGGGADVVTDFSFAEGDRVMLAPGATYAIAASGSNVVVTLSGGETLTLAGVSGASLDSWIVFG